MKTLTYPLIIVTLFALLTIAYPTQAMVVNINDYIVDSPPIPEKHVSPIEKLLQVTVWFLISINAIIANIFLTCLLIKIVRKITLNKRFLFLSLGLYYNSIIIISLVYVYESVFV